MSHVLQELGFELARVDDELHGTATVSPHMWVPGTTGLRTSILATWADHASGLLAADILAPRVPVTLEMDVHTYRQPPGDGGIHVAARILKAGRGIVVCGVDVTDGEGEPVAVGTASFMAARDPRLTMPEAPLDLARALPQHRLAVPFAQRARCERREPGVAVLHAGDDGRNSSNTLNGGLIALVAEEAALSTTAGATLSSLALRYLRPVRVGPAVATAHLRSGLARVEVRDAGSDDRLAVLAITRTLGG